MVLARQYTLPLCWSTSLLRSSNWLAMPHETIRSTALYPDISNSPSAMMKSTLQQLHLVTVGSQFVFRLSKLLGDVVISQGGVVPHIDPALLPTKSGCVINVLSVYLY